MQQSPLTFDQAADLLAKPANPGGPAMASANVPAFSHLRSMALLRKVCFLVMALGLGLIYAELTIEAVDVNGFFFGAARTHPATALALTMAVIATGLQRPLRRARRLETALWLAICGLVLGYPAFDAAGIFEPVKRAAQDTMGANTGITLLMVAFGQLAKRRYPQAAFACAIVSLIAPLLSINGQLLGNEDFFGQMSMTTTLVLLPLVISNMVRFARRRSLRLMLSDTAAGRLVRVQIMLWALGAACSTAIMRVLGFEADNALAILHTAEIAIVLVAIVYFGISFADIQDNARKAHRVLLHASQTDLLTGAARRSAATRYFSERIATAPVAVVLMDVDFFKAINDRFGHNAGDRMLVEIADTLRRGMRISDLLVRWGGEEFLILFSCPDLETLHSRVDRMREAIAAVSDPAGEVRVVTASFGAALSTPGRGRDLSHWLAQADMALYRAKTLGRNRVEVAKAEA